MHSGIIKRPIKFVLALWVLLPVLSLSAQDSEEEWLRCNTDEMQEKLFAERPDIKVEAEALQAEFERMVKNLPTGVFDKKDGEPYIIPVVFHIVHEHGVENISDDQIHNAVEEMTLDFNAENLDLPNVHPAFADIVGNVGVEFRLARKDPNGNCTNGIVRTVSSTTSAGGEILKTVSPIWDRSRYLNIWVCRTIASGSAGYTYYPSSLNGSFGETNDGIVVKHDYVGGIGTSAPGRRHVLTHEVGHWINLAHLWGSSNDPGLEENCGMDDGVADTPNTIGWTTCNVNGQTCGDGLDNVENFMEYAYCSKMFTEGQKTRMLASLNSNVAKRSSLWQEENLIFTGVIDDPEICLADFTADRKTICVGDAIDFSDESFWGVTNRNWIFEGGFPAGSTQQNPTITYNTPGEFAVALLVSDAQGNTQSMVKPTYIRVLDTAAIAPPFNESFEEAIPGMEPVGIPWFEYGPDGAAETDQWMVTDEAAYLGNQSVRILDTDPNGPKRTLASHAFDLGNLEAPPVLTFKYAAAATVSNADALLTVWISKDCGNSWHLRNEISGTALFTGGVVPGIEPFIPETSEWTQATVHHVLDAHLTGRFQVKFEFNPGEANALYIDDINIEPAPITAVGDLPEIGAFRVFPNPTTGRITLETNGTVAENSLVAVLDYTGRIVRDVRVSGGETDAIELDLSGLSDGVYFVRIGDRVTKVMKGR